MDLAPNPAAGESVPASGRAGPRPVRQESSRPPSGGPPADIAPGGTSGTLARWAAPGAGDSGAAEAGGILEALLGAAGESITAVLLFGSRLVGTSPDEHSAFDLFVVVNHYGAFYRGLRRAGHIRRPAGLFATLNRLMPPNVVSFSLPPRTAKLFIMEDHAFERSMSKRAPDHFCRGRLSQRAVVLHARSIAARERMLSLLAGNIRQTLSWAGPFLPASFDVERYARRMLEVSYGAEVRPEAAGRSGEVYEAQRAFFQETYGALLEDFVSEGVLERAPADERTRRGVVYGFADAAVARFTSGAARRGMERYFLRSKTRAVLRWGKYILTYENWLDYLARKVERRSDLRIEITPWERRLPLLLLWPKVFRVLGALRATRNDAAGEDRARRAPETK